MIYDIYWAQARTALTVTQWNKDRFPGKAIGEWVAPATNELAIAIKESKDDSFVFLLSNRGSGQWGPFDDWVEDNDLSKYIQLDAKNISNSTHPEAPRTIRVVVMQSEGHFQTKEKELQDA